MRSYDRVARYRRYMNSIIAVVVLIVAYLQVGETGSGPGSPWSRTCGWSGK